MTDRRCDQRPCCSYANNDRQVNSRLQTLGFFFVLFFYKAVRTFFLQIPRTRLSSTVGSRAFSVFRPSAWNDLPLPLPLRQKPSPDSIKSNLKTFLFPKIVDLACFLFRADVFIHSKSPGRFAARFRLCVFSFV